MRRKATVQPCEAPAPRPFQVENCAYEPCGLPVEPHVTLEPSITENGKTYHWECYEKKYCITIRGGCRQMGLRLES